MGSSQTRARTHVLCIGRQILNHRATREAQEQLLIELFAPFTFVAINTSLLEEWGIVERKQSELEVIEVLLKAKIAYLFDSYNGSNPML